MEQRVIDSEDKLQMIMTHIKNNDLDYEPEIVNQVLSINKDGLGNSPAKKFG